MGNTHKFKNAEIAIKDDKVVGINIKVNDLWYFHINFHENGNIESIKTTINKNCDGMKMIFSEYGIMKGCYTIKDRKIEGFCTTYHDEGTVKISGFKKNGQWNGFCTTYREDGSKEYEANYVDNVTNGTCKTFHPDGNVYENGTNKNGKWNGFCITYREDGSKSIEGNYVDNIPNGPYKTFHPNGNVKENGAKKNGNWDGFCTDYRADGTKLREGNYVNDKPSGIHKLYHPDGITVEYESFWVDGVRHGERKRFDKLGNVIEYYIYENGNIKKYWPDSLKIDQKTVDIDKLQQTFEENVRKFESPPKYIPVEGQNTPVYPVLMQPSAPVKTPEMILMEVLKNFAKIPAISNTETIKPFKETKETKETILLD